MAFLFGVLALSRRLRLPAVVGLLFTGVIVGPHVLQVFGEQRLIADFTRRLSPCDACQPPMRT